MTYADTIDEFLGSWKFLRKMTYDFIKGVPEDKWEYSPHPDYSPLCKQFRHMVWVSGLYNAAIRDRKIDFGKKKSSYSGGLGRNEVVSALEQKDLELTSILNKLRSKDLGDFGIDFFGSIMRLNEYLHVLIQHEAMHHGHWALYAKLGSFSVPKGWKENWEL